jgi:hypothetical protein
MLLAAGVILSTANHFQHGSLFTDTVLPCCKTVSVDTLLFEIWTWTQAIGFEASAGVVLASTLDAQRNKDTVKRNVLLTLMAGLVLVGTTMLVMAFVEAATGFRERDLPAKYGITMSVLRGKGQWGVLRFGPEYQSTPCPLHPLIPSTTHGK